MEQGLLDTSVVIDLAVLPATNLPVKGVLSAISLAELAQGPHATHDPVERGIRQQRIQWLEGNFHALPFDVEAARAYGRIYAAVRAAGRRTRGRTVDLQIAAVALAHGLPLYTRNPDDFRGLDGLVTLVAV